MNRQMVKILTRSGDFILPVGSFYIAEGFILCNVYTGAVLGGMDKAEVEKLAHYWENN